jgi:[ribosomal protein S5]-alanine N-acetyltransferase
MDNPHPTLETQRLLLRPFTMQDAPKVYEYLSDSRIPVRMHRIPNPCTMEWVEHYLYKAIHEDPEIGRFQFALARKSDGELVGRMNIRVAAEHQRAEIGYWIGVPHWGNGYATEAGKRILQYGFESLGVQRIIGTVYSHNRASAQVLQKLGMRYEITRRQDTYKNGVFEDSEIYGILRGEFIV